MNTRTEIELEVMKYLNSKLYIDGVEFERRKNTLRCGRWGIPYPVYVKEIFNVRHINMTPNAYGIHLNDLFAPDAREYCLFYWFTSSVKDLNTKQVTANNITKCEWYLLERDKLIAWLGMTRNVTPDNISDYEKQVREQKKRIKIDDVVEIGIDKSLPTEPITTYIDKKTIGVLSIHGVLE